MTPWVTVAFAWKRICRREGQPNPDVLDETLLRLPT